MLDYYKANKDDFREPYRLGKIDCMKDEILTIKLQHQPYIMLAGRQTV